MLRSSDICISVTLLEHNVCQQYPTAMGPGIGATPAGRFAISGRRVELRPVLLFGSTSILTRRIMSFSGPIREDKVGPPARQPLRGERRKGDQERETLAGGPHERS